MFAKDFYKTQTKSSKSLIGREISVILSNTIASSCVINEKLQNELGRQINTIPDSCSETEKMIYINSVLALFK